VEVELLREWQRTTAGAAQAILQAELVQRVLFPHQHRHLLHL